MIQRKRQHLSAADYVQLLEIIAQEGSAAAAAMKIDVHPNTLRRMMKLRIASSKTLNKLKEYEEKTAG